MKNKNIEKTDSFLKNNYSLKQAKGAILIEFAFAVPILIMTLMFSLDVPLAYRISAKLHKTSELYAQMILNTARKRDSKAITINDLKNVSRAIGLTFTGVIKNSRYPFFLSTYIICVKGTGSNGFNIKWCKHINNNLKDGTIKDSTDQDYAVLVHNAETFTGNIEKLSIQKDEIKLIIETVAWYNDSSRGFNSCFYLLTVPGKNKNNAKTFGNKFAIITPYDGLVTDNTPI